MLVVLVAVLGWAAFFSWLFITVVVPQIKDLQSRSRSARCASNLTRIAVALRAYHQDYGSFPPAVTLDASGRPMHSWRVLILPYLGEADLYANYRRDEPWNGPNNSSLVHRMPEVYLDANDKIGPASGVTTFLAIAGDGTVFPRTGAGKLSAIPDGPADTIMVAEVSGSNVTWMEPVDLQVTQMSYSLTPGPGWRLRTSHGDGPHVAAADGTVYCLRPDTPSSQLRALVTIDGGETINWNGIARPIVP